MSDQNISRSMKKRLNVQAGRPMDEGVYPNAEISPPSSARVEQAIKEYEEAVEAHARNEFLTPAGVVDTAKIKAEKRATLIASVRQEAAEELERLVQLSQQMQAKITELSANERHFRNAIQPLLEGEDDKVKAIQLLCKAGRDEMLRAETAEQQLAASAEEIARLKKELEHVKGVA